MRNEVRSSVPSDLQRLRRRLYAPDATDADQARYAEELARTDRASDGRERTSADVAASATATARSRHRLGAVVIASAAALVVGLVVGAVAAHQVTRQTSAQASPSPSASPSEGASTLRVASRPVVGAALGTDADRRADRRALAVALRLSGVAARQVAVTTVGVRHRPPTDDDWGARNGCSVWTGQRGFSSSGLRSEIQTDAVTSLPTGTRFRLLVYMAGSSDWTWVAGGRDGGSTVTTVALGAGSRASGSSQYAEFTAAAPTTITSLDIRTAPTTPFVWEIDYCTPG